MEVLACDLDRTLIAKDGMLPPRTEAAIRAARAAGIRVVIATGRMFVSVRPYVLQAGIDDPVVCYQGAVVAEPQSGRWLRHEPIPVALAKEAIQAIVDEGFHCNVYVDDELFVGKVTPARAYADFRASSSTRWATSPRGSRSRRRRWCPSASPSSSTALSSA